MRQAKLTAILGLSWGDEGKGKLVDILAEQADFVARFGGGANAGHTIQAQQRKIILHQLPSGALRAKTQLIIGAGCVVHLPTLFEELAALEKLGFNLNERLKISERATLLLDFHKELEEVSSWTKKIGTTKRGIGPAYVDRVQRTSFRVGDLLDFPNFAQELRERLTQFNKKAQRKFNPSQEIAFYQDALERLSGMITDTSQLLQQAQRAGKKILVEGAQGSLLDLDFGTYPFVTSSTTTAAGIFSGLGLPPQRVETIGVLKAYSTRVGAGPFPTELQDQLGERLQRLGQEFGATTGRPRRTGWLDLVATKFAVDLNGIQSLNLTKLDVLSTLPEIKVCTGYELKGQKITHFPARTKLLAQVRPIYKSFPGFKKPISKVRKIAQLPAPAQNYLRFIEKFLKVPIRFVGVGGRRDELARE